MKTRVITAIVAIFVLVSILVFSSTPVLPIAASICALIAVFEIVDCVGVKKTWCLSITTYLFSAAILFLVFSHFLKYLNIVNFTTILFTVVYIYIFLIFAFTMFSKGSIKFSQATELIVLTIYALVGFMAIVLLRNIVPAGKYLYLLIFIGAWMTDTGAYFIGVFFGKHKLIPEVSPKKTVEGALGGILGCIVGYLVFALILNAFFEVKVNYIGLILLAVVISVISQCGDLIASYVKRDRGIKDYGKIFPGHGGMMDRFDSIIAVAPIILSIVLLLPENIQIFSLITA